MDICQLFTFASSKKEGNNWNFLSINVYADSCFPEIKLHKSVSSVLSGYTKKKSIMVDVKNEGVLNFLKSKESGQWVKVYEAGYQNGKKVEVHYFKNKNTGTIGDVKIKYEEWHQKEFKNL